MQIIEQKVDHKQLDLDVSRYTKELGTGTHLRISNRSYPFILPGLGDSGVHCQKCIVSGIGINGDTLGYMSLKCKRIECPNCYKNWVLEKVFNITFKIEAYAKVTGDRPSHVVSSINPELCRSWDWGDYETFHRRSYRHIAAMGGVSGCRVFHPYRINSAAKTQLKAVGYGVEGKGLWKGVRDNALNLPSLESYYSLAVHDHNIVFPSFLDEHRDRAFFVKKLAVLPGIEDVIKMSYYVISHCGILKGSEEIDNFPVVFFGDLHRFQPENFLDEKEILNLKTQIAEKLHCKIVDGELKPVSDDEKPSNAADFHPIHDFVGYSKESEEWISAVVSSFPEKYRSWWWSVILGYQDKLNDPELSKDERHLFLDDLDIPEGIKLVEVV